MAGTETPDIRRWTALAGIVLRHYSLVDPHPEFLRHNENVTFRVSAASGRERYLLRLYQPAGGNFLAQSSVAIESELLWLEALARETSVPVQQPVPNRRGQLVTAITPIGTTQPVQCSLLHWLDGEPLHRDMADLPTLYSRLGEQIARLHNHASRWSPPRGFVRQAYDAGFLARSVALLSAGVETGIFTGQVLEALRRAAEKVADVVSSIEQTRQTWGLVHSDLQGANILVHEGDVRPIDFSLCGFACYLFDFGTSLPYHEPDLRDAMLAGYRQHRPLPIEHLKLIDAFCLFSMINCYAFLLPDERNREWLARRVPQVAANECQAFLRGESFVFAL